MGSEALDLPLRRTPLFSRHGELGGKLVGFAGWELPVQYAGVISEHQAVRSGAGLFDVSHMGEVFVDGPEAEKALNALTCNDVATLVDGKAHYNAIINPNGGVVDDIIIYRFSPTSYLVCVNASNADKDFAWFLKHNRWNASFVNRSDEYGQIALQGPRAVEVMQSCGESGKAIASLKYFHFLQGSLLGVPVIAARTGYTGEDGFEFFVKNAHTVKLWDALLDAGKMVGVVPCGLGARDSLRLEACLPLHGHELSDEISAVESGLGWIVKLSKGEFIGREALEAHMRAGAPRKLVGFLLDDAGIARECSPVFDAAGARVGVVTSGTKTPTLNRALGMALIETRCAAPETALQFEVRARKLNGRVAAMPFYKKTKR